MNEHMAHEGRATDQAWMELGFDVSAWVATSPDTARLRIDVESDEAHASSVWVVRGPKRDIVDVYLRYDLSVMRRGGRRVGFALRKDHGFAALGTAGPISDDQLRCYERTLDRDDTTGHLDVCTGLGHVLRLLGASGPESLTISAEDDGGTWDRVVAGDGAQPPTLEQQVGQALADLGLEARHVEGRGHRMRVNHHPVMARASKDESRVEVVAPVVRGVTSRRQAALELAVLNRTTVWVKYLLLGRDIVQVLTLPGQPFVAEHLGRQLPPYLRLLDEVPEDLALRTGGRVAR